MDGDVWYFDKIAPVYDWIIPVADPTLLEQGLAQASRPVARVVDLGGGTGRAVQAITASQKIVVDASRRMLREADEETWRIQGSATMVPLSSNSVDAILVVDALHHLPETSTVFGEAERVLRGGGVIVIQDFDRASIRGRLVALGEHCIGMKSEFYTAEQIAKQLENAGFISIVLNTGFRYCVVGRSVETKPGRP